MSDWGFGLVVCPLIGNVQESHCINKERVAVEDLAKLHIFDVGKCQLDRDFTQVFYTSLQVYVGASMWSVRHIALDMNNWLDIWKIGEKKTDETIAKVL